MDLSFSFNWMYLLISWIVHYCYLTTQLTNATWIVTVFDCCDYAIRNHQLPSCAFKLLRALMENLRLFHIRKCNSVKKQEVFLIIVHLLAQKKLKKLIHVNEHQMMEKKCTAECKRNATKVSVWSFILLIHSNYLSSLYKSFHERLLLHPRSSFIDQKRIIFQKNEPLLRLAIEFEH